MRGGPRRRSNTESVRSASAHWTRKSGMPMGGWRSHIALRAIGRKQSQPAVTSSGPIRGSASLSCCRPLRCPSSAVGTRLGRRRGGCRSWSPASPSPALFGPIPAAPRSGSRSARPCAGWGCRNSAGQGRSRLVEERVERRLAAILCADVVEYSRLMGADEEKTLAVLKSHRRELIDPLIDQHRGRIFKTTGDGMLIEFASVVDAVRCAVVVQRGMEDRNANLPESERIRLRIGINLGDVMVDEGDMFGDGVNVASRIEGLAAPGEICVSYSVREQVGEKLPIRFTDLGEHGVKNIARPVRVYRVEKGAEARAGAADDRTQDPLGLTDRPSLAVMPFTNMSGDPEQEYFVDGIVEDIITGLSRIKWLFVIARNSTFVYKGRVADLKQVGRELGARYVLEGSLRKAGNRVRVTVQLIEAASGTHVWAKRYDRALDDIFELQDEITLSVVGAIEPSLRQAEIERAKRKRPDSLDAYDLYLRALPHARVYMPSGADQALPLLHRALSLQPDYPAAQA